MTSKGFGNTVSSSFPKCITKENNDNFTAFGVLVSDDRECIRTIIDSTGSKFDVILHCEKDKPDGQHVVQDGTGMVRAVSPDSVNGTIQWVTNGDSININFSATHSGPACGEVK
jgi:hypothetical protein